MKKRIVSISPVALVFTVAVALLVAFVNLVVTPRQSEDLQIVDVRIYAVDPESGEKYPLTFLYAVDEHTGQILVYSPIIGTVHGTGNLKQSEFRLAGEHTASGYPTNCNRVEAGDGDLTDDNQPFLTWTDRQDQNQHQFFTSGEVVFITDQPLKHDANHILDSIPAAK